MGFTVGLWGVSRQLWMEDEQLKVLQKLLAKNGISDFKFGSNKDGVGCFFGGGVRWTLNPKP